MKQISVVGEGRYLSGIELNLDGLRVIQYNLNSYTKSIKLLGSKCKPNALIIIFITKGLDNLDENSGAGSDDESVYDKSYIDLPHSANPEKTKSINISIKGKLRHNKYMRTF